MNENPNHQTGFYGTGNCFLWRYDKDIRGIRVYYATGKNNYFILSESGADLAFGGGSGSSFGLWLDENLYNGHSVGCDTFENEPLAQDDPSGAFHVDNLECWSFEL
ncbi:MAG: hypothetical protein SGCHY_002034 [Lobulomycetales sp.]